MNAFYFRLLRRSLPLAAFVDKVGRLATVAKKRKYVSFVGDLANIYFESREDARAFAVLNSGEPWLMEVDGLTVEIAEAFLA